MTSIYGLSIEKSRPFKNKFSENVENSVSDYGDLIVRYSKRNKDDKCGFVTRIKSVNLHYSYPQLAKSMMNNYNTFIDKISKLVNILYYNIDAILIDESGFKILNEMGYIGDKLGQFKVENIFKEISIISPRKRIGITINDEIIKVPKNLDSQAHNITQIGDLMQAMPAALCNVEK